MAMHVLLRPVQRSASNHADNHPRSGGVDGWAVLQELQYRRPNLAERVILDSYAYTVYIRLCWYLLLACFKNTVYTTVYPVFLWSTP